MYFYSCMKTRESYPFLVWATTIIIAPLIIILLPSFYDGNKITKADFEYIDIFWIVSFVWSLPTLLIYCIVFYSLRKKISSTTIFKWILIGTCILGIIMTFAAISINFIFDSESWAMIGCYSLSAIIVSFIFKIQKKDPKISN